MQVKFKIEERPGKGKCVIADQFIAKDAITWKLDAAPFKFFHSRQEPEDYLQDKSAEERVRVLDRAFGTADGRVVHLLDNANLMNHDSHSNTLHDNVNLVERAARDIQCGEEITNNYAHYAIVDWFDALCKEHGVSTTTDVISTYS